MRVCLFVLVMLLSLSHFAYGDESKQQPYPWLDAMHQGIADSVDVSAQWFDDFFVDGPTSEDQQARGEARIRLGWEPRSRDWNEFEAKVKVRVKLPKLKDKVDVIFSDYDDDEPDDRISSSGGQRRDQQERFNLALRFKPRPDSGLSHRIGVGRRAQVYARTRYENHLSFSEQTDLRWETSVYYYNRDHFGGNAQFTFDHRADSDSIWRLSNRFYFRDQTNDWIWQHGAQLFVQEDAKSAVIYGYYIEGETRPNYRLTEHLVSIRWRQNALREWLFYEVEPFILFRRDEGFHASYGVALRVEGNFGHH